MPKITSVEPQKKSASRRTHRFNVYLDGQFAFGADEDLVVDRRLIVGKEVSKEELEKLIWEAEVGKLMDRVYVLFDRRARSEKEVRDYLNNLSFKRKVKDQDEISDQAIELVVENLKRKGLLNDLEFAKAWLESRSKKKGIQVIKSELFKKGISREVIDEVLHWYSEHGAGDSQGQVAEKLLIKRLPRLRMLSEMEQKKKAYEFLMRRGFDYDLVKSIVEKVLKKEYTSS